MLRPALKMLAVLWTGLRNRLPGVLRLVQRGEQFQAWSLSLAALYSRRFGARAIVWLGVLASAYALYLYAIRHRA